MAIVGWFGQHWFDFFQTVTIVGGLIFTAVSIRDQTHAQRITNLVALTGNHREIWENLFIFPALARVLDESPDLANAPVTPNEQLFVMLVIQHVNSAFHSIKDSLVIKPESLQRDVALFFGLPIPNAVWRQVRELQDGDFVGFVESCLNSK